MHNVWQYVDALCTLLLSLSLSHSDMQLALGRNHFLHLLSTHYLGPSCIIKPLQKAKMISESLLYGLWDETPSTTMLWIINLCSHQSSAQKVKHVKACIERSLFARIHFCLSYFYFLIEGERGQKIPLSSFPEGGHITVRSVVMEFWWQAGSHPNFIPFSPLFSWEENLSFIRVLTAVCWR